MCTYDEVTCGPEGIKGLPDLWLVGYGLDDRGTKRGWVELFAMPKVKIAETIDKDEVDRLIAFLDDEAALTCHHVFGGIELPFSSSKQRYVVLVLFLMSCTQSEF